MRGNLLTSYRLFFIGWDQHIVKADVVNCSTDDDALAAARRSCRNHRAVEVWELARRVGRVDARAEAQTESAS